MQIVELPEPRRSMAVTLTRLWRARSELKGRPSMRQSRSMARNGGVSPSLHVFDRHAFYAPDELGEDVERQLDTPALFYTFRWGRCWLPMAVFPDGTEVALDK